MASSKDIKRFAFRLNRQLVKAEKAYQSKIYNELKRQQKEIIKNDGKFESKLDVILLDMYESLGINIFQTQIEALGTTFKKERFWMEGWRKWIKEFVSKDIKRTIVNMDDWTTERYNEIKKQIQQTITESGLSIPNSEFEKRLFEKTGNGIFSKSRARTIARTESAKVANESKRQSAETWESETGVELYKEWIHRGAKDPRTGHERLDGVMIPKDEQFQVISESGQVEYIDYPLAPEVSPENSINCGCQVVYVSKNYAERMKNR